MTSPRRALIPPSQSKAALASFNHEAAKRAIYLDYEGIRSKPPVFLGWEVEGTYQGAIIDPAFHDCAHLYKAKQLSAAEHREAVQILIQRAFVEQRHLVSWSWHDLKFVWPLVARREQDLFVEHFVNAIRVARRWHGEHFGPGLKKKNAKLSYFASAIGMSIPDKYGQKVVANHIAKVGKGLAEKGSYGALSAEERGSWVDATKHNRWDLRATARVCQVITGGGVPIDGFCPPPGVMSD